MTLEQNGRAAVERAKAMPDAPFQGLKSTGEKRGEKARDPEAVTAMGSEPHISPAPKRRRRGEKTSAREWVGLMGCRVPARGVAGFGPGPALPRAPLGEGSGSWKVSVLVVGHPPSLPSRKNRLVRGKERYKEAWEEKGGGAWWVVKLDTQMFVRRC